MRTDSPYPTRSATVATVAEPERSMSAARAMRQLVTNAVGGSPTNAENRWANAARQPPAAAARFAIVQVCAGSPKMSSSAPPTTGSCSARHHRAAFSGRSNHARNAAMRSRFSSRSRKASCPGPSRRAPRPAAVPAGHLTRRPAAPRRWRLRDSRAVVTVASNVALNDRLDAADLTEEPWQAFCASGSPGTTSGP